MPLNDEHVQHTLKKYDVMGDDIHKWMDEPSRIAGNDHRRFRHDPDQEIPSCFIEKYGEDLARNILLDHIYLDTLNKSEISPITKNKQPSCEKPPEYGTNEYWEQKIVERFYMKVDEVSSKKIECIKELSENKTIPYWQYSLARYDYEGIRGKNQDYFEKLVYQKIYEWMKENGYTIVW